MATTQTKVIPFSESHQVDGSRVGRIDRIDSAGRVWVDYESNPHGAIVARISGGVQQALASISRVEETEVLVIFENGQSNQPVVVDVLYNRFASKQEPEDSIAILPDAGELRDAVIDGEKITFDASEQIELKCGKSSIILTKKGKIIIKGAYLLNRSTGVNHIKGGSVKIN